MPLSLFPEEVLVPEQTPLLDRRSGVPRVPLQAFRIEHAAAQKVARRPQSNTGVFDETLLEGHRFKSSSKALDLLVAVLIHVIILGGPILAGLYYTDSFNLKEYTKTLLVAPPPPPPPPPPALAGVVKALAVKRANIAVLLRELEEKQLLRRVPAGRDKRFLGRELAPLGKRRLAQWLKLADRHEERLAALIGVSEREAFLRSLQRVAEGLADPGRD